MKAMYKSELAAAVRPRLPPLTTCQPPRQTPPPSTRPLPLREIRYRNPSITIPKRKLFKIENLFAHIKKKL